MDLGEFNKFLAGFPIESEQQPPVTATENTIPDLDAQILALQKQKEDREKRQREMEERKAIQTIQIHSPGVAGEPIHNVLTEIKDVLVDLRQHLGTLLEREIHNTSYVYRTVKELKDIVKDHSLGVYLDIKPGVAPKGKNVTSRNMVTTGELTLSREAGGAQTFPGATGLSYRDEGEVECMIIPIHNGVFKNPEGGWFKKGRTYFALEGKKSREHQIRDIMQKIREQKKQTKTEKHKEDKNSLSSSHKFTRTKNPKIRIGWQHYKNSAYKQVFFKNGGGIRELPLPTLDTDVGDIILLGTDVFFPDGVSKLGRLEDMEVFLGDYAGRQIKSFQCGNEETESLGNYLTAHGVHLSRTTFYLMTKETDKTEAMAVETCKMDDAISSHAAVTVKMGDSVSGHAGTSSQPLSYGDPSKSVMKVGPKLSSYNPYVVMSSCPYQPVNTSGSSGPVSSCSSQSVSSLNCCVPVIRSDQSKKDIRTSPSRPMSLAPFKRVGANPSRTVISAQLCRSVPTQLDSCLSGISSDRSSMVTNLGPRHQTISSGPSGPTQPISSSSHTGISLDQPVLSSSNSNARKSSINSNPSQLVLSLDPSQLVFISDCSQLVISSDPAQPAIQSNLAQPVSSHNPSQSDFSLDPKMVSGFDPIQQVISPDPSPPPISPYTSQVAIGLDSTPPVLNLEHSHQAIRYHHTQLGSSSVANQAVARSESTKADSQSKPDQTAVHVSSSNLSKPSLLNKESAEKILLPFDFFGKVMEKQAINIQYLFESTSKYSDERTLTMCHSIAQCKDLIFDDPVLDDDFNPCLNGFYVGRIEVAGKCFLETDFQPRSGLMQKVRRFPASRDSNSLIMHDLHEIWGYDNGNLLIGIVVCLVDNVMYEWYKDNIVIHSGPSSNIMVVKEPGVYSCQVSFSEVKQMSQSLHIISVDVGSADSKGPSGMIGDSTTLSDCFRVPYGTEHSTVKGQTEMHTARFAVPDVSANELNIDNFSAIGQGAFATVHKGIWAGSDVAVKTISFTKRTKKSMMRLIEKEINICSKLRHPNIIQFLAVAREATQVHLVYELITGCNMEEAIFDGETKRKMAIQPSNKVFILKQCAQAIAYMHALVPVILHQDIKPSNIMIKSGCFTTKVCDLGVSRVKSVAAATTTVATSTVCGSPAYIAPECLLHDAKTTPATDIWSLGITMIEFLAEEDAWMVDDCIDPVSAITEKMKKKVSPLLDRRLQPTAIMSLLARCVDYNDSARPTAVEILNCLSSL